MMEWRQYTTNRATAWAATLLMAWAGLAIAGGETGAEERFAAARDAFRAGERVRLAKLGESLRGSEFAGWVEYWQLRLRLEENTDEGVAEFLERECDSYLAEKMRGEKKKPKGKGKKAKEAEDEAAGAEPGAEQPLEEEEAAIANILDREEEEEEYQQD